MIFEDNFHFFECPKYTQQRNILLQQFRAIEVPFQIDYILYGSSEYAYNLNCKIICYVLNFIRLTKHFDL
jgi:hypothetical protein